jgi:hypothetical protein
MLVFCVVTPCGLVGGEYQHIGEKHTVSTIRARRKYVCAKHLYVTNPHGVTIHTTNIYI